MSVILHCLGICKLVQKPVHGFSVRKHTFRNSQKHIVFSCSRPSQNQNPGSFSPICIPGTRNPAFVIFTTQVSFSTLYALGFRNPSLLHCQYRRIHETASIPPIHLWSSGIPTLFQPSLLPSLSPLSMSCLWFSVNAFLHCTI